MYDKRYAIFVLHDSKGRVLLQHRDKDAPKDAGLWSFFGGSIDEGESPTQAVRREAKEELGLQTRFRFFGRYEVKEEDGFHEKFLFVAPLRQELDKLKERQKEGDDLGLFTYEEIQGISVPEGAMAILRDFFHKTVKSGVIEVEKA